ncbi:MAG: hypothetical protein IT457_17110 [Planctomycetes bacterium]|nr:hypothetical protein [Planctomycetota bacterium]
MHRLGTLVLVAIAVLAIWRLAHAAPPPDVLTVRVDLDGKVTIGGEPLKLEEAVMMIGSRQSDRLLVWFQREESRDGRPSPAAKLLLAKIHELGVPISLSSEPGFGDIIERDGSLSKRKRMR